MILNPVNDVGCLGQLTKIARELWSTTLVQTVAKRLGSREAVVRWFQSLPQADDDGEEQVRFIECDVPQRVRLLPDDPNCVERATGALMLLEVTDPKTPRALATVDRPMRHTGLVEKRGGRWHAVDLFPRRNAQRNFDWGEFGKDALQGVHSYVGKPIIKFYLGADQGGQVADTLGGYEDTAIGRGKKNEKKDATPSQKPAPAAQPKPAAAQPKPSGGGQPRKLLRPAIAARLFGTGTTPGPSPSGGGGKDGQTKQEGTSGSGAAAPDAGDGAAAGAVEAADRGDRDPHDEGEEAQRFWWTFGR